jgi:hypothetical protein
MISSVVSLSENALAICYCYISNDSSLYLYGRSIIGSVLLVAGLYNVLWGKSREDKQQAAAGETTTDSGRDKAEDVEKNAAAVQPADGEEEQDHGTHGDARGRGQSLT